MKLARSGRFLKDTRGGGMVEYVILVGVIAMLAIGAFRLFGGAIQKKVNQQQGTVDAVESSS
jgi:Flp pilus assembly pilin Flp